MSTLASLTRTASAPAASAPRMTVPALPGSRTLVRTTSRRGDRSSTAARSTPSGRQTASSPCGAGVSDIAASTSLLTSWTSTPASTAERSSSVCRAAASGEWNRSRMSPGAWATASRTDCGPSARKRPSRERTARRANARTAFTRSDRGLVSTEVAPARGVAGAVSGGVGRVDRRLGRDVGPGDLDQRREGGGVVDGQLGQHATVHLDLGGLQALDEPVVRHAVGAGPGVDALDPEATEVALARTAVTVGVAEGVGDLLLGLAVQTGALAAVTAGPLEDNPALLVGVDRPLHACHVRLLAVSMLNRDKPARFWRWCGRLLAEKLLDLLGLRRGEHQVL